MTEEWKLQVSPKLPDGTLINLRAQNGAEMTAMLAWLASNAQDVTSTAALLSGAGNAAAAGLTRPATSGFIQANEQQQGPPPDWAQPKEQSGWGAPQSSPPGPANATTCIHGQRKRVTGQGDNGPWAGWFCPTPKGAPDKCKTVYE